jgi:hypothetical protein
LAPQPPSQPLIPPPSHLRKTVALPPCPLASPVLRGSGGLYVVSHPPAFPLGVGKSRYYRGGRRRLDGLSVVTGQPVAVSGRCL